MQLLGGVASAVRVDQKRTGAPTQGPIRGSRNDRMNVNQLI